jgi:hypothetical protein
MKRNGLLSSFALGVGVWSRRKSGIPPMSKFTPPTEIKVGWKVFKLNLRWNPPTKDDFGNMDHAGDRINISKRLKGLNRVEVVVHELFHAMANIWSIDKHLEEKEEAIVDSFGNAFVTVVKDNPGLLEWILNEVKESGGSSSSTPSSVPSTPPSSPSS